MRISLKLFWDAFLWRFLLWFCLSLLKSTIEIIDSSFLCQFCHFFVSAALRAKFCMGTAAYSFVPPKNAGKRSLHLFWKCSLHTNHQCGGNLRCSFQCRGLPLEINATPMHVLNCRTFLSAVGCWCRNVCSCTSDQQQPPAQVWT